MRIADKMAFDQVNGNLAKNRSQMSDLQNQAATQKRVTKPSDDPLAASRVLGSRIDLQGNKQFSKSMTYEKSFLEYTDESLGELSELLVRAKELALSQSNDASANEESRRVVATELDQIFNQMVSIGNRKLGDRFIFGGFHTQNTPFDDEGHYGGDAGEMMVQVDKESFLPMNVPGSRVFLGKGISPDGMVKEPDPQPRTIEELDAQEVRQAHERVRQNEKTQMRGPASLTGEPHAAQPDRDEQGGINLFHLVRGLGIALRANDKAGVQDTLDVLDKGMEQVVLTRSQVGSRSMALDNFLQTAEKQKVDNKTAISQLEDADVFSTVSDINKTQSTLQATLETSGKLIQPSLLQFLR